MTLLDGFDTESASRPPGPRRTRRSTVTRFRLIVWAGGTVLAILGLLALATVPVAVLAVSAALLVAALVWRSRSSRSAGLGLMPLAVVWGSLVALVLSLGAVALNGALPDRGLLSGANSSASGPVQQDPVAGVPSVPAATPTPGASLSPAASPSPSAGAVESPPQPSASAAPSSASSAPPASAAPVVSAPAVAVSASAAAVPVPTYRNCAAVRAAGAAPLYWWQPGYTPALDKDGDGIACN